MKKSSHKQQIRVPQVFRWGRMGIALLSVILGVWVGAAVPSMAQTPLPSDPLDVDESDPLLPDLVIDRPLSPQERSVLAAALEELRLQAEQRYASGDIAGALNLWIRELRLRRVLGIEEEVTALSRVGAVAWRENQTTEVRLITERLLEIEQEVQAQPPVNYDLLLQIAQAYQTLRARGPAVTLYNQILAQARQEQNVQTEEQALRALGDLHLAWFDYPNAAATYRELLALMRQRGDRPGVINTLTQLAYVYTEGKQPAEALEVRQELVSIYEQIPDYTPIPALKIAIADDYVALGRPDRAAPNYQEAFAVARSVQYFGYAADALSKLADLYRSLDRPDDALVVYQLLLDVELQAYNYYGMMTAYDQLGQLYRDRGATNQALVAFRQGLDLAQQLNYRVDYFTQQVQALNP